VIPLEISTEKVIPIPCILDAGAPSIMNLGTGAMRALFQLGLVHEDGIIHLRGILSWREHSIDRPIVEALPCRYESYITRDIRLNVLGLDGMD